MTRKGETGRDGWDGRGGSVTDDSYEETSSLGVDSCGPRIRSIHSLEVASDWLSWLGAVMCITSSGHRHESFMTYMMDEGGSKM